MLVSNPDTRIENLVVCAQKLKKIYLHFAAIKKECYDYFTSAEIEVENETCNRTYENLEKIRERGD